MDTLHSRFRVLILLFSMFIQFALTPMDDYQMISLIGYSMDWQLEGTLFLLWSLFS